MNDKVQKAIAAQKKMADGLAVKQIPYLIGEAVLRVLAQGQPLTVEALEQAMRQPVAHLAERDYGRTTVEVAIAALRGESTTPSQSA